MRGSAREKDPHTWLIEVLIPRLFQVGFKQQSWGFQRGTVMITVNCKVFDTWPATSLTEGIVCSLSRLVPMFDGSEQM